MSGNPHFASPDRSVEVEDEVDVRHRILPPYHVVLLDDDDHTFEYVIHMLQSLFGMPPERNLGQRLALSPPICRTLRMWKGPLPKLNKRSVR